jgi:hypothetical protein
MNLLVHNILLCCHCHTISSLSNHDYYDIGKDFILPIILAIGAAFMAYIIFVLETRREKQKEEERKKDIQKEKVMYFKSLVRNSITYLKAQIKYIKDCSDKINKDPLNLPLLEIRILYDLDRLVFKINQEEYYLAYLSQFKSTNESVEEFRKIYSYLDFFEASIREVKTQYEKGLGFDYQRKIRYKDLFEKNLDYIAITILRDSKFSTYPGLVRLVNQVVVAYHENKTATDGVEYAQRAFVDVLKKELIALGGNIPEINETLMNLKNLTITYNDIRLQNEFMANEFKELYENLEKKLADLETNTKKLMDFHY